LEGEEEGASADSGLWRESKRVLGLYRGLVQEVPVPILGFYAGGAGADSGLWRESKRVSRRFRALEGEEEGVSADFVLLESEEGVSVPIPGFNAGGARPILSFDVGGVRPILGFDTGDARPILGFDAEMLGRY
jgi:hypothetical protein